MFSGYCTEPGPHRPQVRKAAARCLLHAQGGSEPLTPSHSPKTVAATVLQGTPGRLLHLRIFPALGDDRELQSQAPIFSHRELDCSRETG